MKEWAFLCFFFVFLFLIFFFFYSFLVFLVFYFFILLPILAKKCIMECSFSFHSNPFIIITLNFYPISTASQGYWKQPQVVCSSGSYTVRHARKHLHLCLWSSPWPHHFPVRIIFKNASNSKLSTYHCFKIIENLTLLVT